MTTARWMSALGMLAIAALATSCAASLTTTAPSSAPAIAPPTATVPPWATVPATTAAATPVPPATATIQASTTATANPCLAFAASHAFIQLSTAVATPDGSLTLTGHPATMSCGGPDDFHYNVATSTEVARALPGATVQVLGTSGSTTEQTIPHAQFPSYLASDHNTRVFIFTGPLSAVTALQEQFHP